MVITINVTIPGSTPVTAALSEVLEVRDPSTGQLDYALDPGAVTDLLDAWSSAAPYRGYTVESTGDHDWEWIYAEPWGSSDPRLRFDHWQAAAESDPDAPRDRWMLSDFSVAVEVARQPATGPGPGG